MAQPQHQNRPQSFQQNRQQENRPQQASPVTTAPGTTKEEALSPDKSRLETPFDHTGSTFDSFLEEEGILDEVNNTASNRITLLEIFKIALGQAAQEIIVGARSPLSVKVSFREWFISLTPEQQQQNQQQLIEVARYALNQLEEIVNETPAIFMINT